MTEEKADAGAGLPEHPPPIDEDEDSSKTTDADSEKANDADDEEKAPEKVDSDDDDAPESVPADTDPDDLLLRAMSHKEDGNTHFKSGDMDNAARSYRKGTNLAKKVVAPGDEQVKCLLITLQTNLSMVCFKQKKHRMSRDVASKVLEIDSKNVKALYRRAVAHRAMGDVDAARTDLKDALKTDPDNLSVKKELVAVKKISDQRKKKEKAGLAKAFSQKGSSSFLYSDKEEEEKKKERERKKKDKLEEEKKERRKKEWEDECVRRMAEDPKAEVQSFEDWDKLRKEAEDEKEKARKKAKKAAEAAKNEERRKARRENKKNEVESDDDDELTEKELAMLRGYKKTSDGRTTSYFNREQTEHDKKLLGSIAPKQIDSTASSVASSATGAASPGGVGSVWNQSGTTWEEKDTTDWCKKTFEQCLLDTTSAYYSTTSDDATYVAVVKKVDSLTGDASVAIAGGKKRYIYDFHASVEYDIQDEEGKVLASGKIRLPDVNSATTAEEELDVEITRWKKSPPNVGEGDGGGTKLLHAVNDCAECRKVLVQDVRKSVLKFVEKFNKNF